MSATSRPPDASTPCWRELTGLPRADIQRAITAGRVTVDGEPRAKSFRLAGGEALVIEVPDDAELEPEGPAVPVRYRDEHLLVIAKPAGLVTHPTENRRSGTLVNRLLGMGVPLSTTGGPLRPGIVHRLDAGTSGLMVWRRPTVPTRRSPRCFRRHDVERRYLALVRGEVEHEAFAVDAPLGRHADKVVVDAPRAGRPKPAFEVRERLRRPHAPRGDPEDRPHPPDPRAPAGDRAPDRGGPGLRGRGRCRERLGLQRPFLHSWRIAFDHPITGERIELEEPLPDDLETALRLARTQTIERA